jgi:hypothetical protein
VGSRHPLSGDVDINSPASVAGVAVCHKTAAARSTAQNLRTPTDTHICIV